MKEYYNPATSKAIDSIVGCLSPLTLAAIVSNIHEINYESVTKGQEEFVGKCHTALLAIVGRVEADRLIEQASGIPA